MYYDLNKIKILGGNKVYVCFEDNKEGVVDLTEIVDSGGVFDKLRDASFFEKAFIDKDWATLAWPGGIDIAPETLYEMTQLC